MKMRYVKMRAGFYKVYCDNKYIGHVESYRNRHVSKSMWQFVNFSAYPGMPTIYERVYATSLKQCKADIASMIIRKRNGMCECCNTYYTECQRDASHKVCECWENAICGGCGGGLIWHSDMEKGN